MNKTIHLVSFDVPFPADYGGVIDVFFKLKSLHDAGVKVILHCFEYGRGAQIELEKYCHKIFYYKRKRSLRFLSSDLPFIVASRLSENLLSNLKKDDHPIIFEGIHTCGFLNDPSLSVRKKIVRCHNVEHQYYLGLSKAEKNIFKKRFFKTESEKLKKFETVLSCATSLAVINQAEVSHFLSLNSRTFYLPPFHGNSKVTSESGKGKYVLFHGNLSVRENEEAAEFIIKKIALFSVLPVYIAGKDPSGNLEKLAGKNKNVILVNTFLSNNMDHLIKNAHINLMLTFRPSGVKLKLLHSLYKGRFCIANHEMVAGTGLNSLCLLTQSEKEIINAINDLANREFEKEEIKKRESILSEKFSDEVSVRILTEHL